MEGRIVAFRQRVQEQLDRFQHALKHFVEKYPFVIKLYHVLSWVSFIVFLLSLIFIEDSRTVLVQFLWSFYVILQFWLLARSKTLPWKQYITFFLVGAWVITPFTALFVNVTHLIFGGTTSAFWSTAILTPIAEEIFKLIPVLVFLFVSKRTSSLSLTDFMLMGAAVGAGFQFLEETARRLQASTYFPYGHSLFGKYMNWELFSFFPGWFELEYFPYIMTTSHAVQTALMALGIGIALRLRNRLKRYAYIIPVFLYILGTLDHAAWNGDGSMPDWVESIHELVGNGYYTKPLLLILLVGAIIVDYWWLNQKRDELKLLKGEKFINPLSEIYQLLRTFILERSKFWHLMYFYRDRRELGFSLLSGNQELQKRTTDLRGIVEKHYKILIAVTGLLLIAASAMTSELLLHNSANSCFACLFDGLQFWWDRLSGVEKAAIVLTGFALTFPLLGFWSAFSVVTTTTGIFASGYQIADVIRNPNNLKSPEYAMSAIIVVGLNRIPGGKVVADELVDAGKSIRRSDSAKADQKHSSPNVADDTTFKGMGEDIGKITIPSIRNGEFNTWFDELSTEEFYRMWESPELRKKIEDRIRKPGGYHEWHLVARTPKFKEWGISMNDIKEMRTLTKDVKFVNPPGEHGGAGSTVAHNQILRIIDTSEDYETFVKRLNNWAEDRLQNGKMGLPIGLRR